MGVELLSVSRIQAGGFGLLPSLLQAISLQLAVVPASLLLDLVLLWLNPVQFEGHLEKQVTFSALLFACSSIPVCCRLISFFISALFTELWCCGDGFSLQERQCCFPRETIRIFLRKAELKFFHLLFLIIGTIKCCAEVKILSRISGLKLVFPFCFFLVALLFLIYPDSPGFQLWALQRNEN